MKNINILYEDELCLVLDKPAGLAVQGGKEIKTSLDKILAKSRSPAPLLVHRLDLDTSGVILTAKTKEAAAFFSRLLGDGRQTIKKYIAVCFGTFEKKQGCIKLDLDIKGKMKKTETRYKVLKSGFFSAENGSLNFTYSVLEIELGTGRTHQIRRHLSMNKTPILGDDKYGDFSLNKKLRKLGHKRLFLHARQLEIRGEYELNAVSPLPEWFFCFTGCIIYE